MARPASHATLSAEFDDFLFAPVGDEDNGMSLSVMSALARLNMDPWQEAARLASLSKEKAVEALAPMLARLPVGCWNAVDVPAIARRLVDFLPQRTAVIQAVTTMRVGSAGRTRAGYVALVILFALLGFAFVANNQRTADGDATPSKTSDAPH